MRPTCALAVLLLHLAASSAAASWLDTAWKFQTWCERPAKSLSLGLSDAKRELFVRDVERKLKQLKIAGAKVQIAVDKKQVLVQVRYRYPQPERWIVRREYFDGILKVTDRVDYGWEVNIVAEKGRLITSDVEQISEYHTF